jgi:hypothetical protein
LDSWSDVPNQVFEVDVEVEGKDEVRELWLLSCALLFVCLFSQESAFRFKSQHITKQGWLYKGPDSAHEASIISFTRV